MDVLATTMLSVLIVASSVRCGSGVVVDSLGVPVRGARVTRLSDSSVAVADRDGRWTFGDTAGAGGGDGRKDGPRLTRVPARLRLVFGGDRDAAGRVVSASSVNVRTMSAVAARSIAPTDSVRVEARGWRPRTLAYDSASPAHRAVLELAPSRGMVAINGGFDSLGSVSIANNKPHVARVAGFWIDTVEVTQRLYDSLVGRNPSFHGGCPSCPVERVSWFDAARFCNARSRAESLPAVYDTSNPDSLMWTWDPVSPGFRLPTDAEWECAARAGSSSDWYWGPYLNKETVVQYAWYDLNAGDSTHPVGRLKPNGFGLHDVSGNVSEWTNDWFEDLGSDSLVYPKGAPGLQEWKVVRGGDFGSQNTSVISTQRPPSHPATRWLSLGFRCARGVMP